MKTIYFLALLLFTCQISVANATSLSFVDPTMPTMPTLSACDDNQDGFTVFDLTVQNAVILEAQTGSSSDYVISYHETLTGANNGGDIISNATSYFNLNPFFQIVYVRIRDVNTSIFVVGSFQLNVDSSPLAINLPNIVLCDADVNANDGITLVNLASQTPLVLAQQISSPSSYTVTYFTNQANAEAGIGPIIQATNYVGTNGQTIWVRVENSASGCYAIASFQIVINQPPTLVQPLAPLRVCDSNGDGIAVFDLTDIVLAQVILGPAQLPANFTISYYLTASGANPLTNVGQTPLPSSYSNVTPNSQTIYIRVVNNATGCVNATGVLTLVVQQQAFAAGPQFFSDCDNYNDPYDGVYRINLTQYDFSILNGQNPAVFLLSYYTSLADAVSGTNALTGAEAIAYETDPDTDTIWVKVENSSNSITPYCYAITTINLNIQRYPNPIITTVNNVNTICVDFVTNDVVRNLTLDSGIVNPSAYTFQWFEASNPSVVIGTGQSFTVNTAAVNGATRNYSVKATSNSVLGCTSLSSSFTVVQSGKASPNFGSIGYEVINLSGVQSIIVNISGYGTYQYSLDNGTRQTSTIFNNVSLGLHTVTVWDTEGGTIYSCDPLIITDVEIAPSPIPAPTGLTSQSFPAGATLGSIVVVGENIQWFATPYSNATPLPLNTVLVNGVTYYATQTVDGIQSTARFGVTVQVTLGVTDNAILTLNYLPNPVKDVLTIESNTVLKSILVYNLLGQKVYEDTFNGTTIAVDLSSLQDGNYIVKVQGDLAQKTIKIVKH